MADEQTNQPSRAEQIREVSAEQEKKIVAAFEKAASAPAGQPQVVSLIQAFAAVALWGFSWFPEIAAELAEMNSRDREAEIRAKNAEQFVAGIQSELRSQGIVMTAAMPNVKPPRGK